MILEITRLVLGLLILCFHRPIADFILERERRLASMLSQRGIFIPEMPSRELTHDLYFGIGAFVSVVCVIRLLMAAYVR